jgi:hypothetical protein
LRGVHNPDIETTLDEPLHEIRLQADLGAHRDVGRDLQHQRQPFQQELFPQSETTADSQRGAKASGDTNIVTSLFHGADERRGVLLELPACRRERGAGLVPDDCG